MRELRQDWRDIFGSFLSAFRFWKILLALAGLVVTYLVLWGLMSIHETTASGSPLAGWIIALIAAVLVLVATGVKFALSDTGFSKSKLIMFLVMFVVLAGVVLLCAFTKTAAGWGRAGGITLAVLVIWAFFGGAITRIAAVEVATDDRVSLGEAVCFARRKFGAYLGATLLPALAVIFLALCCVAWGLLFNLPVVDIIISVLFFLVLIAGFLMFLVALGGTAGLPLMYPAVSSEGNDSFDAISRAYSYVLSRPWRYLWYNAVALVYGTVCTFFVAVFARYMVRWSLAAADYGADGHIAKFIWPRLHTLLNPIMKPIIWVVGKLGGWVQQVDITGYVSGLYIRLAGLSGLQTWPKDNLDLGGTDAASAVLIAIALYAVVGVVAAYAVSLFFTLQTKIYLLLRKAEDGAAMTDVYREEDEDDYLTVAPETEAAPAAEEKKEEDAEEEGDEKKSSKKSTKSKKAKDEEKSE